MSEIKNLRPGQTFGYHGVKYRMVRWTGNTVPMATRNQFGRVVGSHRADSVVVSAFTRGEWGRPKYVGFPQDAKIVENI